MTRENNVPNIFRMSGDPRPNILWYCTDQQRFDTIAALGNPHVCTPTLDSLVGEGTAFTHAYCQSPICTPSRASYMTGMYPSRIANCRNGNDDWPGHPPLISKLLADAGYHCGLIGKFHLLSSGRRTEPRLDDGYRYWKFSHAPRDDWPAGHDYAAWVASRGGDLDALRESPSRVPPELHQTTWATDRAIEFIDRDRVDDPWMLTLNVYDPHPPFIPPREYAVRFDRATVPGPHFRESDLDVQRSLAAVDFQTLARDPRLAGDAGATEFAETPDAFDGRKVQALYYAMIAQIDDQFARLLDHLDATRQRESTVVIFTSDHGETLGDHGLLYKGCRFYEGLVRVPLIFHWPGRVQAGLASEALVELTDLSATILELAEVARPGAMQGRSLLPILGGEADPSLHREAVRCEYFDALDGTFLETRRSAGPLPSTEVTDAAGEPVAGSLATMYRDRRYKLSVYHGCDLGELYDLQDDPWEHENLWNSAGHRDVKLRMLHAAFDSTVGASVNVGSRRIAPM